MLRRISVLIALGLGCVALAWGLFYLHGIFVEERDDALGEIAARRRTLEQFAHKELEQRLRDQLAKARPTIDSASRDPLIPASQMWLVDRGQQLLPRTAQAQPVSSTPATTLYQLLISGASGLALERARHDDPDSPWSERLALLEDLKAALHVHNRLRIEARFRQILSHPFDLNADHIPEN